VKFFKILENTCLVSLIQSNNTSRNRLSYHTEPQQSSSPSGVYQLEMSDESGQFTLSSSVIAIRRGEQQIVRVELRPLSALNEMAQNGEEAKNNAGELGGTMPLALADLSTLKADQLAWKLNILQDQPLMRNSVVTTPSTRRGFADGG
jgi:hypothetical protein